jgi:hypothetical protein
MTNDETPKDERKSGHEGQTMINMFLFAMRLPDFLHPSSFGFRHSLDPTTERLQRLRNAAVLAHSPEVNGNQN